MVELEPSPVKGGGRRGDHFLTDSPHASLWGRARTHIPEAESPRTGSGSLHPSHCHPCGAAPYPVQELIRGCHGRQGARRRVGRLFARWLIALSFTAAAPPPPRSAPQTGRWGASCQKRGEAALNNTHHPSPKPPTLGLLLKWGN